MDLQSLAATHYENFPVGSIFIPKKYRDAVHLIYAFARAADDIADEGTMAADERIAKLDRWQKLLHSALNGDSSDRFFTSLASAVHRHQFSPQLFDDLITAFRRDAANPIYHTFDELIDYCSYSANPVGRLMLQLFGCFNETNAALSDNICTALQLTNFWQDISVDTGRNRLYIPTSDLAAFDLNRTDFLADEQFASFRAMMKMQVERTGKLFQDGKPLMSLVSKNFRFELWLIWHGGVRMLEMIKAKNYDTRTMRPKISSIDTIRIFSRAIVDRTM